MSAVLLEGRQDPGKKASAVFALAVHAALIVLLIYGVRWQTRSPEPVEVELVRAAPAVAPPPVAEPLPNFEPPPKAVEPPPKAEPKPAPKPDIALKEKEKEKPKAQPEPKLEPKPVPKVERKPMPNHALLAEEFKRLEGRKADQELDKLASERAAAARGKAMADYIGRIKGKIKGNIVLPPGLKGNPETTFTVAQLPSGEILSVKLKQSSGNAALDAAIERAILKSSPLPTPEDKGLFERNLELKFRPLED